MSDSDSVADQKMFYQQMTNQAPNNIDVSPKVSSESSNTNFSKGQIERENYWQSIKLDSIGTNEELYYTNGDQFDIKTTSCFKPNLIFYTN